MNSPFSLLLAVGTAAMLCSSTPAAADTFTYDDAGRLVSATQSNGLSHAYSYDAESNLLVVSHGSSDTTDLGGAGNGIPDWWEYLYFGSRGLNPLAAPAGDGLPNLVKYALGLNPLVSIAGSPVSMSFQAFTDGKVYPYLSYVRWKEAASQITLEQSSNLTSWQSGGSYLGQVSAQDLGNGTELLVLRCLTPVPDALRLFFRIKVTGN